MPCFCLHCRVPCHAAVCIASCSCAAACAGGNLRPQRAPASPRHRLRRLLLRATGEARVSDAERCWPLSRHARPPAIPSPPAVAARTTAASAHAAISCYLPRTHSCHLAAGRRAAACRAARPPCRRPAFGRPMCRRELARLYGRAETAGRV